MSPSSELVDLEKAPRDPKSDLHPSQHQGSPLSTLELPDGTETQQHLVESDGEPFHSQFRELLFIMTVCSGQLITQVRPDLQTYHGPSLSSVTCDLRASIRFRIQAQIGSTMLPLPLIGARLGTDDGGEWSWFAASYA